MITLFFSVIFAFALAVPFLGRGLIGVGLGILVIASIGLLIKDRKDIMWNGLFKAKEIWILIALSVSWFISGQFGLKPEEAVSEWAQQSGMALGGILIYAGLTRHDFSFDTFYRFCTLFAAGFSALVIVKSFMPDVMPENWGNSAYGSVLAVISPFVVYGVVTHKKVFNWIAVALLVAAVFALGGRTGWLAIAVSAVSFFIFFPWKTVDFKWVSRLVLIGVMVGASFAGVKTYQQSVDEVMFETRVTHVDPSRPASGRLSLWDDMLGSIGDRPWFGVGIKGFRQLEFKEKTLHAHNVILELIIDTGFVGISLLSLLVLYMVGQFLKYYRRSKDNGLCARVMPIFVACVAYGTASMSLTSFFHAWWFLYCVAFLVLIKYATARLKVAQK